MPFLRNSFIFGQSAGFWGRAVQPAEVLEHPASKKRWLQEWSRPSPPVGKHIVKEPGSQTASSLPAPPNHLL